MKIARKSRVLTDVVLRSLSAPIYCRDLDTTALKELINTEGWVVWRYARRLYRGWSIGSHITETGTDKYGSVKNHKKTVKIEQTQTRESEEFKKKPKIQSRSPKSQASVKSSHVAMEKAQWNVGFCTKLLTKEAQTSHQWNDTLAIFRCLQLDQTATNEAQMIEEMIGQD
ncbi:hypothetical protein Tco_0961718 [Tanacetum coccineum]